MNLLENERLSHVSHLIDRHPERVAPALLSLYRCWLIRQIEQHMRNGLPLPTA